MRFIPACSPDYIDGAVKSGWITLISLLLIACDKGSQDPADAGVDVAAPVAGAPELEVNDEVKISCIIGTQKTSYIVGEIPKMNVMLTNQGDETIVLPRVLDGSEVGWRFPKCGIELYDENQEPILLQGIGRCGNMSTLRAEDFVRLSPNESFDLAQNGYAGFAAFHQISQKPGTYWIRYYYQTSGGAVEDYYGDERMMEVPEVDAEIRKLASRVPKVSVYSNMQKLVIEEIANP